MIWTVLAFFGLAAWVYLAFWHGAFWRADQRLHYTPEPPAWPDIAAVIPARDEARSIYQVIVAHLRTDYPGRFDVILVDDNSTDGTADLAREAAEDKPHALHIVSGKPLPDGWTGKMWAVQQGLDAAREISPDAKHILLTDADIVHGAGTLRRLVARSERQDLALASLMARLDSRGVWGGLLMPAFVYFFQMLYPFPWANDPNRYLAAAAGGCMLTRRDCLDAIGGVEPIRDKLIDDCALSEQIKGQPPVRRIWIGLAKDEAFSLRDNRSFSSIWNMVARTAYAQLGFSPALLAGTIAGMFIVYLAAPLAVLTWPLHHHAAAGWLGLIAWAAMTLTYLPTALLYGQAFWKAVFLPAAAVFYSAMTVGSAVRHWHGKGGQWKGRSYPAPGAPASPETGSDA